MPIKLNIAKTTTKLFIGLVTVLMFFAIYRMLPDEELQQVNNIDMAYRVIRTQALNPPTDIQSDTVKIATMLHLVMALFLLLL